MGSIERCSAITFADHKSILLFDAQSEFFIPELVNAQGERLWNAINIETGTLTKNVFYEGGQGLFYDSVVFFTKRARDCTIMRLPEVGVAIQFAKHRDAMLAKESDASQPSRYQHDLDWRKDNAAPNNPYLPFWDE